MSSFSHDVSNFPQKQNQPSRFAQQNEDLQDDSSVQSYNQGEPNEIEENDHHVIFFVDEIKVEKSSADSAQSIVYFGTESTIGIRVVLKQYLSNSFQSMFREVKIFTLLQEYKKTNTDQSSLLKVLETSKKSDFLPELLGYKIGRGVGEILMTNGGECLDGWIERIQLRKNRIGFMAEMLRQVLPGLAHLHMIGYSHGDLKLENICARTSINNNFKFTLIDFGMSQKLPQQDKPNKKNTYFRGNFMFSSINQMKKFKPSMVCDVFSLICVCYYFIENGLPWTDYSDLRMAKDPSINLYELETFKKIRIDHDEEFKVQFRQSVQPFGDIFTYIFELMDKQTIINPVVVNYDHILKMLPADLTYVKTQLQYQEQITQQPNGLKPDLSHMRKQMMKSIDLNFSGFQKKRDKTEMQALKDQDIPKLRIHNAEQCYNDAKKLAEHQLLTVKELKALIRKSANEENYIVSQYTSPLYLANLKLCANKTNLGIVQSANQLTFQVLEKQSELDSVAYDASQQQQERDEFMSEKVKEMVELRKNKKLHEKAEHLLGRSFRNCVIHSQSEQQMQSNRARQYQNSARSKNLMTSQHQKPQADKGQEANNKIQQKKGVSNFKKQVDLEDDCSDEEEKEPETQHIKQQKKVPTLKNQNKDSTEIDDPDFDYDLNLLNTNEFVTMPSNNSAMIKQQSKSQKLEHNLAGSSVSNEEQKQTVEDLLLRHVLEARAFSVKKIKK